MLNRIVIVIIQIFIEQININFLPFIVNINYYIVFKFFLIFNYDYNNFKKNMSFIYGRINSKNNASFHYSKIH